MEVNEVKEVKEVNDDTFGRLNYAASQAIVFNFEQSDNFFNSFNFFNF